MDYHLWWREGYFAESKLYARPLSGDSNSIDTIFDSHSYEKGALVIHLMRHIANRQPKTKGSSENFSQALKLYLDGKGGGNVRNDHLQAALESINHRSWQEFFDQWVRSKGHPIISAEINIKENTIVGMIEQVQATRETNRWRAFSFPLDIEIIGKRGEKVIQTVQIDQATQSFQLDLGFPPSAFNLDPDLIVPAEIEFRGSKVTLRANWLRILRHSTKEKSRLVALKRLFQVKPSTSDWRTYVDTIMADPSLYIKAESIAILSQYLEGFSHIERIIDHIADLPSSQLDLSIRRALAHGKTWLANHSPKQASHEAVLQWQSEYNASQYTSEREAILNKMSYAKLSMAQEFALERLQESHWVTKDRAHLIDVLTRTPSSISRNFIFKMIESGSYHWFKRIIDNLLLNGYQDEDLPAALINRAKNARYDYEIIYAIKSLSIQEEAKDEVCPFLYAMKGIGSAERAHFKDIQQAAIKAINKLECQKL